MMAPSLLDHLLGGGAGHVGLGLRVAGDELHLLAEDAVALEGLGRHGVEQAAVALAVEVLDGELVGLEFVLALLGIGAGLRHVEAERDGRARSRLRVVADRLVVSPGAADEMQRADAAEAECAEAGGGGERSFQDGAPRIRRYQPRLAVCHVLLLRSFPFRLGPRIEPRESSSFPRGRTLAAIVKRSIND